MIADRVRLAVTAPAPIGGRAAYTLAQLLAAEGIAAERTASLVLDWPCATLPSTPQAWEEPHPEADDPVAYAFRHLTLGRPQPARPVDDVRRRVREWVAAERLRTEPPWPDDRRCALAILHDVRLEAKGLRARLRRSNPLDPWRRIAALDARFDATTHALDQGLPPERREGLLELGLLEENRGPVRLEPGAGFLAGTAFPYRPYLVGEDRPGTTTLLPVAARGDADAVIAAINDLARSGGGAAVIVEHREPEDIDRYAAVLRSARVNDAWCTTAALIAGRLPL